MTNDGDSLSEIKIGNVRGDLSGNVAGRDINIDQSVSAQPLPVEKEDAANELRELLAAIQQQLAEVVAEQNALKEISSAAPLVYQGAEQAIKDASENVDVDMSTETAQSVQENFKEATSLLTGILNGAKTVIEKAGELGSAAKPIADKLEPLIGNMGRALLLLKLWI